MRVHIAGEIKRRGTPVGLSLPLMLLVGGCEPISAETVLGFAADFARSALAAWLL